MDFFMSDAKLPQDDPEKYKTFDKKIDPRLQEYLKWEKVECNSQLVKDLALKKDLKNLRLMLCKRLELSNGGVRGEMIPGFNGINDLVIIQTGQGLIKYLEETDKDTLKENGIVIGYDGRFNSKRYAEVTATIFVNQNYPVKLFGREIITPFIPLAVTMYNCVAGVMISGGSCSKNYNGFKVFGSNGCQVISPVDTGIEEHILDNLEPVEDSWNVDILEVAQMLSDPYAEVLEAYLKFVSESIFEGYKAIAAKAVIKFAYTPLHGVAYEVMQKVAKNHCLMVESVPSQVKPDPKFPTVNIPDPEDPKSLNKAKAHADKTGIRYVFATDPDACRMVFSYKDKTTNIWTTFSSGELAALFGWWTLDQYKQTAPKPQNLSSVYMVATTTSSKILRTMARKEKFNFIETLPGFRWIANQVYDLKTQDNQTIFSFEENYGFMFNDDILTKDGIQASIQMMTMICYLDNTGITLADKLEEIYAQYGYHLYIGSYFKADEHEALEKIFDNLRSYPNNDTYKPKENCTCIPEAYRDPKQEGCHCNPYPPSSNIKVYPKSIGKGKYEICHIRDITLGFDNNEPSRRAVLPAQPDTQMITFEFVNGLVTTIRVNPKEPKLRYCAELILKPKPPEPPEVEKSSKSDQKLPKNQIKPQEKQGDDPDNPQKLPDGIVEPLRSLMKLVDSLPKFPDLPKKSMSKPQKPEEPMTKTEGSTLVNEMMHKMIHDFINPAKNGLSLPP